MLMLIAVLMLSIWAVPAQDLLSPQINILDEIGKIKTLEQTMKSMETEMERLKTENKGKIKPLPMICHMPLFFSFTLICV